MPIVLLLVVLVIGIGIGGVRGYTRYQQKSAVRRQQLEIEGDETRRRIASHFDYE